ncbi:MAG: translation elongation factor Ts [Puniceicoccales bacterium]|jgi:elongation factor Ts|nr:translation elongation factor Ts [Puniceicoccales bacterium]
MSEITAAKVNELRRRSGAGFVDCKKVLDEAGGDIEEAIVLLRKKGSATAAKKAGRETHAGLIESYIHNGGRIGVLLELNCETDFVARNEDFRELAADICLHIAASNPLYLSRDLVPQSVIDQEREIAAAQVTGKPSAIAEKIVEGKMDKWFGQVCLLEQPFARNQDIRLEEHLAAVVSRIGENIRIGRFARYQLGE